MMWIYVIQMFSHIDTDLQMSYNQLIKQSNFIYTATNSAVEEYVLSPVMKWLLFSGRKYQTDHSPGGQLSASTMTFRKIGTYTASQTHPFFF